MENVDFPFKVKPFRHQLSAFQHSRELESFALFMDMGTGKSKIIIDTVAWLFSRGQVNGLLVIAPKGVYANWVHDQLPKHMPDFIAERMKVVLWQSNYKSKKFQEQVRSIFTPDPLALHVLVVNIEATKVKECVRLCVQFLNSHDVMMVVDESTIIKHHTTDWTERVIKLGRGARYRRILTGTPITNSPLDVYSQFEFLDPDILGFSSFFAFRNRYAILQQRRVSSRSFTQIVGYQRLNELREKMQRAAIIIKKEECLDLPPKTYVSREIELSDRQRKLYDMMKRTSLAELENVGFVTVELVLTKILRLHQICCGFLPLTTFDALQADMDGRAVDASVKIEDIDPGGGPRLQELARVLEETSSKVIIWANYTRNIEQIADMLRSRYDSSSFAVYSGRTGQDERSDAIRRFQDPADRLRFFVGQTRTGGFGITLTEAKTVVYFSNDYNLETRLQSEDRAHRIGQTSAVTYVDLVARGTIDQRILEVLRSKKSLADTVTGEGWRNLFIDPRDDAPVPPAGPRGTAGPAAVDVLPLPGRPDYPAT